VVLHANAGCFSPSFSIVSLLLPLLLPLAIPTRYAGAASGPKDVVLVIDKSGSMDRQGRMAIAKSAVRKEVIHMC
jgi:hypothetical protein